MKTLRKITALILLVLINSCSQDEPTTPTDTKSNEANLLKLELEYNGTTYPTSISGTNVTLSDILPYGTEEASIKNLEISEKATTNKKIGDKLQVSDSPISIEVTAENGTTKKSYSVNLEVATPSTEANLLEISFTFNGNDYSSTINDGLIIFSEEFAYNSTGNMTVKSFNLSEKATSNISIGQNFDIANPPNVVVTSQDGQTQSNYEIRINKDQDGDFLINQFTQRACNNFETFAFDDLILENNMWNSDNLLSGSFSQCVYRYTNNTTDIFGWQWDFPDDAYGVNAYPQVIYGWKPWQSQSSTQNLPKKISEIDKLKVAYEVEVYRNDGDYNLAFDNWINSSSNINPQNIQFEFMIWEEANNLVPFGDFQEDVNITNGKYKFYMGEPDWEPAGSNWTYVAFKRVSGRKSGTVDVDELLEYLVNKGIVSQDSYLASIEFGNEIGNSTGYTVVKQFEIEIE